MKELTTDVRYEMLYRQFQVPNDEQTKYHEKLECSLNRVFKYIYYYTNIMYIEFINRETLYNYIRFHCSKEFKEVAFTEVIRDVKNFLYFLKYIKKIHHVPKVNLAVENVCLWTEI